MVEGGAVRRSKLDMRKGYPQTVASVALCIAGGGGDGWCVVGFAERSSVAVCYLRVQAGGAWVGTLEMGNCRLEKGLVEMCLADWGKLRSNVGSGMGLSREGRAVICMRAASAARLDQESPARI